MVCGPGGTAVAVKGVRQSGWPTPSILTSAPSGSELNTNCPEPSMAEVGVVIAEVCPAVWCRLLRQGLGSLDSTGGFWEVSGGVVVEAAGVPLLSGCDVGGVSAAADPVFCCCNTRAISAFCLACSCLM